MSRLIKVHVGSGADSVVPVANEALRITPEHRDVLERGPVEVAGLRVPVVAPAELSVFDVEVLHQIRVVVGNATTTTRFCLHGWRLLGEIGERAGTGKESEAHGHERLEEAHVELECVVITQTLEQGVEVELTLKKWWRESVTVRE
jgi:hypothetical protein